MQEEIIKHSKKAYQKMKSSNHTMVEKLKEIGIEIFIIVFAVTLSIWLHGWSEHQHQQNEVKVFLADMREDITSDIASMTKANQDLSASANNFNFLLQLDEHKIDSIEKSNGSLGFNTNLGTTKINNGNYEGFKSSGKIGNIENKILKKLILSYYQELTPDVIEIEKLSDNQFSKMLDYMAETSELGWKNTFLNKKFKLLLKNYIDYSNGNENIYRETIKIAGEILIEIDKELGK